MTTIILSAVIVFLIIVILVMSFGMTSISRKNDELEAQNKKFRAINTAREIQDREELNKMFEDLEREELIYMNTM